MPQEERLPSGYVGQKRSGTALTLIIAGHGAVLAALMLIKMEVVPVPKAPPIKIWTVPIKPPPPPVPPPPDPQRVPQQPAPRSNIDVPEPIVPRPTEGPTVEPNRTPPVYFDPGPIGPATEPGPGPQPPVAPPAPPPEPPAPRVQPVKLAPRGNPSRWVTNDDYPDAALRAEEQGRTSFRLAVDATGRPTACTVTGSSGSPRLDGAACRLLMKRARFNPGSDENGNPMGGNYANSFSWQIPDD